MKIAALQMVSGTSLSANLAQARSLLAQAAQAGAELAVLPEYFAQLGRHDSDKLAIQEAQGQGPIQDFLAHSAREFGLWIVGGTLPLGQADGAAPRVYNSSLVFDPQGACVARYDKIHLFSFDNGRESYDEARTMLPGRSPVVFELQSRAGERWRFGLSVCYDLRFPEHYRHLIDRGAQVLLVPSAFTYTTGRVHWDTLLRARAIENLAYVLASAQGGTHENGRRTWGHSLVYDPWGELLACQPEAAGLVLAELDAARLAACRRQLPALNHRLP